MALTDKLTAIANAIRTKAGTTGKLTLAEMPSAIANIPTGGETYVETLAGDGTNVLNVSSLPDGIYHGKRKETTSPSYCIVGFALIKQGNQTAFIVKNISNAYRNYIASNGTISANQTTQLFIGTYDIFKVSDLEY